MVSWTFLTTHLLDGTLYLDPGSGSFLLQLLIGALMGGLLAVKIYWRKIKAFFKRETPSETTENNDEEE